MSKSDNYRLNVRVGSYIYTVDVWKMPISGKWFARFKNPNIDNFEQVDKITEQDIIDFIHEEYPEKV